MGSECSNTVRIQICCFSVFSFYCAVRKRLVLLLTCVLYCVMFAADETGRWNSKYTSVGGPEMLPLAMENAGKLEYDGDYSSGLGFTSYICK